MIRNALFWANYIRSIIIPEISLFAEAFDGRILLAFQRIEEEAEKIQQEKWERLSRFFEDPSDVFEAGQDAGIDHYVMMKDLKQGTINMFAAAAYHLFEQHMFIIHRKELLSFNEEDNDDLFNWKELVKRLKKQKIYIKKFSAWPKLEELRLVANTVKYADGRSAARLKHQRPDMFSHPKSEFKLGSKTARRIQVFKPLFGQGVYVTPDGFRKYLQAMTEFWEELASALEGCSTEGAPAY